MKLPTYKRIYTTDYEKEQQPLVDAISFPINSGFESLYDLSNNKISFVDNIASTVSNIQITVDAQGIPIKSTVYPLKLSTSVLGTFVVSAVNSSTISTIYPTSAPFITGVKNQNNFIIQHITGLPANVPFNLTVITIQN